MKQEQRQYGIFFENIIGVPGGNSDHNEQLLQSPMSSSMKQANLSHIKSHLYSTDQPVIKFLRQFNSQQSRLLLASLLQSILKDQLQNGGGFLDEYSFSSTLGLKQEGIQSKPNKSQDENAYFLRSIEKIIKILQNNLTSNQGFLMRQKMQQCQLQLKSQKRINQVLNKNNELMSIKIQEANNKKQQLIKLQEKITRLQKQMKASGKLKNRLQRQLKTAQTKIYCQQHELGQAEKFQLKNIKLQAENAHLHEILAKMQQQKQHIAWQHQKVKLSLNQVRKSYLKLQNHNDELCERLMFKESVQVQSNINLSMNQQQQRPIWQEPPAGLKTSSDSHLSSSSPMSSLIQANSKNDDEE